MPALTSLRDLTSPASAADVVVIGAGLAGALTAGALARRGCRVALVDRHAEPRPEFRAEQLVGPQIGKLAGLGALTGMVRDIAPHRITVTARGGRVIGRTVVDQFGVTYDAMVKAARAAVPSDVRRHLGRVVDIAAGDARQAVILADGGRIEARLVVLATGMIGALPRAAGLSYRTIRADHSLTLGFDLAPTSGWTASSQPLVYYATTTRDRIDYLATFGMDGRLRANLFCYHSATSDWAKAFRHDPSRSLTAAMPGLDRLLGPVSVSSPVEIRSNDLRVAADPVRTGLVLVGDAFQTPCPAAGTGIDRLLSDIEALVRHVPVWLASPGMGPGKIAAFYADPAKRAADAEALRIAEYRRSVSTETGLKWRVHRAQVSARQRTRHEMSGLMARLSKLAIRRAA